MDIARVADAEAFLELTAPLVGAAEARNNVFLGILGTLRTQPEVYRVFRLWAALEGDRPVAAALRTDPYNLVVADAAVDAALEPLLAAVREDLGEIPGVVVNSPFAERVETIWIEMTGARVAQRFAEGVFELTEVAEVPRAHGDVRAATRADRDVLLDWFGAFAAEALAHRPPEGEEHIRYAVDTRLDHADAGLWLWIDDGQPVSLAGYGGPTPSGIRIGPVYTPPEHRRRGYGSALTAALSQRLLDEGRSFCFLFTDLANRTSNRIYRAIGYERVCDASEFAFTTEPRSGRRTARTPGCRRG
jgi:predicted GNAT family acetyltransferase